MVAVSTRLPESEAEDFEALVRRHALAVTGEEGGLSSATALRLLVRAALKANALPSFAAKPKGRPR